MEDCPRFRRGLKNGASSAPRRDSYLSLDTRKQQISEAQRRRSRATYVCTGLLFRSSDRRFAVSTGELMRVGVANDSSAIAARVSSAYRLCPRASPDLCRRQHYCCCWHSANHFEERYPSFFQQLNHSRTKKRDSAHSFHVLIIHAAMIAEYFEIASERSAKLPRELRLMRATRLILICNAGSICEVLRSEEKKEPELLRRMFNAFSRFYILIFTMISTILACCKEWTL